MSKDKSRPNVHIPYDQLIQVYHKEIARLVHKYTIDSSEVLDIGCGVGHTLVEVRRLNPNIQLIAADIDNETLRITNERVKLEHQLKISTVEDLFENEERYDVIIMSHVLEHTLRPLDIVKGLNNMLKPDGVAILAVPNPVRLTVFLGNIFKKHYVNRGHVYSWDRSHWINFLENIAGLNVIEYSQDFFPLPLLGRFRIFRPLEVFFSKLFPWLSFSNIAVIRKSGT